MGGPGARNSQVGPSEFGWVADLMRVMWIHVSRAVEDQARQLVPEALAESKPSFVHAMTLRRFELGKAPPVVTNVRVHSNATLVPEAFLEFDFSWRSEQDVSIEIVVPQLPLALSEVVPDIIEDSFRLLLTTSVTVRRLSVAGAARVTLRPLYDRLPVVGGAQLSLVRPPAVDYEFSCGLVPAALTPAIKTWMDGALKELVFAPFVLPGHLWCQVDPEARDVEKPAGVLRVKIARAENVPRVSWFGELNPYVELYVRSEGRRKTRPVPGSDPSWDAAFELPVHVPEHQELTLILYDHDPWSADDEIGRAEVPLRTLAPGRRQALTLQISSREEKTAAEESERAGVARSALMALGRPFTKQSAVAAALHLEVEYIPFAEPDYRLIGEGLRGGWRAVAADPEALSAPPHLRDLLLGGSVTLGLPRVEGLRVAHPLLRTPTMKAVLSVGEAWEESEAHRVSRRGGVEFLRPVRVHLPAEATLKKDTQVVVQLRQHDAHPVAGSVAVPLAEVVRRGRVAGEFELAGSGGARARVELTWQGHLF